jgi:hypothetical protein
MRVELQFYHNPVPMGRKLLGPLILMLRLRNRRKEAF